jgi:hypothetical protein
MTSTVTGPSRATGTEVTADLTAARTRPGQRPQSSYLFELSSYHTASAAVAVAPDRGLSRDRAPAAARPAGQCNHSIAMSVAH